MINKVLPAAANVAVGSGLSPSPGKLVKVFKKAGGVVEKKKGGVVAVPPKIVFKED